VRANKWRLARYFFLIHSPINAASYGSVWNSGFYCYLSGCQHLAKKVDSPICLLVVGLLNLA